MLSHQHVWRTELARTLQQSYRVIRCTDRAFYLRTLIDSLTEKYELLTHRVEVHEVSLQVHNLRGILSEQGQILG